MELVSYIIEIFFVPQIVEKYANDLSIFFHIPFVLQLSKLDTNGLSACLMWLPLHGFVP